MVLRQPKWWLPVSLGMCVLEFGFGQGCWSERELPSAQFYEKKKKKKRAITAPWQASELSWDGCLLVNSPLGGNFLPSPRRSRDPRELGPGTAHLWVSVSKSVKRHSSRGSLCTAERIWDLTDAPTGQRQSLRAETRGLGGNAWRAVPWAQSGAPGQGPAGDAGAPLRGAGAGCGHLGLFNSEGDRAPSLRGSKRGRGVRSRQGRAAHE